MEQSTKSQSANKLATATGCLEPSKNLPEIEDVKVDRGDVLVEAGSGVIEADASSHVKMEEAAPATETEASPSTEVKVECGEVALPVSAKETGATQSADVSVKKEDDFVSDTVVNEGMEVAASELAASTSIRISDTSPLLKQEANEQTDAGKSEDSTKKRGDEGEEEISEEAWRCDGKTDVKEAEASSHVKMEEVAPDTVMEATPSTEVKVECGEVALPVSAKETGASQSTDVSVKKEDDCVSATVVNESMAVVASELAASTSVQINDSSPLLKQEANQQTEAGKNEDSMEQSEGEEEDEISEEEWRSEMKSILDDVDFKGDYCIGEQVALPPFHPKIVVKGMNERLAFPLPTSQAKELIGIAEKAPFGKGMETVLDESVRKAWQVDAANVSFEDLGSWSTALQNLTKKCVAAMGLTSTQQAKVHSNLYKMLLYEPGGHFQKHRDTEKEPGMFGTLVIQLPSKHEGGGLVINHRNYTRTFDFSRNSQDGCFVTAFYADCEHEFLEVTSGYRLCLVYNLVMRREQTSVLPTAQALTAQTYELRRLAHHLGSGNLSLNDVQGYLLEHKYTTTNLRFQNLKGRDKQVADLLRGVKDKDDKPLFVVCLLVLEKWEVGAASGGDCYRYRDRYGDESDDGDHYMEELHDCSVKADFWVGPDDKPISDFRLGFSVEEQLLAEEDTCEDDLFEDEQPDREEYEGFTGNAGPSIEYWYYKSVLVFWPRSSHMAIASQAGINFLLSSLNASTVQSDIQGFGAQIIGLVESGRQEVTAGVLKALVKVANESLIIRALKKLDRLTGSNFPAVLVQVVGQFKSTEAQSAVLDMLVSSSMLLAKNSSLSLKDTLQFLKLLDKNGPVDFVDQARGAVTTGALKCISDLVKRESECKLLIPVLFHLPDAFRTFIDGVIAFGGTVGPILAELLMVSPAPATNEQLIRLAKVRAKQLKTMTSAGPPIFSWCQPKANFPGSHAAALNSFLRGPEKSKEFYGFNGIDHARNWARKYFGRYVSGSGSYCATASAMGRGGSSFVVVTKTRTAHETAKKAYDTNMSELCKLCSIFGPIVGEAPVKRLAGDSPTLTKKAKTSAATDVPLAGRPAPEEGNKENPIIL